MTRAMLLRWELNGWLVPASRNPGEHPRYRVEDVEAVVRHQPGRFTRWWVPKR